MITELFFLVLALSALAEENLPFVILAITEQNSTRSDILLDGIFPVFLQNKISRQFIIDVIPSGSMRWNSQSQSFICQNGEDQCSRQLLQYCAIREYSFELSHKFVRCVQLTPGTSANAYSTCKRFAPLQYSVIDECMQNPEKIGKELIHLGQKYRNQHSSSFPQLFINNKPLSVDNIESNPVPLFEKLQQRLCSLSDLVSNPPPFCSEDYRVRVEIFKIHQEEQMQRVSNFQSRFPKYTREVFSMRTLKAYSELIQHPIVRLQIFYDPSDRASFGRFRGLQAIDTPDFHAFTSIELFPLGLADPAGIADLDSGSKDRQWLRRAALCAILELPAERAIQLQLCLLHSEGSAESVIRTCSAQWDVFRVSLEKCAESEWVRNYARNMTLRAKQAVYERSQSRVLFDLAATAAEEEEEEDPLLEAEADQDGDGEEMEMEVEVEMEGQLVEKEASQMLKEMMPLTFLVNGKPLHESELLTAALCNAVLPSQPLVCQKRRAIEPLRWHPTAVNLTVYVNTNCNNNVDALAPLMNWIASDPEIIDKVTVGFNPLIDVLIDRNDRAEFEFRTPNTYKHIAVSMALACAFHINGRPDLFWPFAQCVMSKGSDGYGKMTQCADQAGYAVEDIGNCLQDEDFITTLWQEKMEDLEMKRWYSVSPYILLNGERVSRIEEIPEKICAILHEESGFCKKLPSLPTATSLCHIRVVWDVCYQERRRE